LGEWLWLFPLANYLLAWAASNLHAAVFGGTPIWFLLMVSAQGCASLAAIYGLSTSIQERKHIADRRWTDWFGCASCAVAGGWLVFNLVAHPIVI
jgi:hypothetical protein